MTTTESAPRTSIPTGRPPVTADPPVDAPTADAAPSAGGLERALKLATGIVAPTTVLTALCFYFGYVATDSFYEYYGVDAATLQFSTRDYLLRSVSALYVPVGVVLVTALVVSVVHPHLIACVRRSDLRHQVRTALRVVVVVAAVAVVFGMSTVVFPGGPGRDSLAGPLGIGVGVLALFYARTLVRARRPGPTPDGHEVTAAVLVAAITIVSGFWAANTYAERYGRGQAEVLARDIRLRPAVVLDTQEPLFVELPGVSVTALPDAVSGQHFHYRYRGLRLLAQSGQRMFFVPTSWTPADGQTLMLTDDDSIRVQFAGG